jgi:hypothetical protein
LLRFVSSFGFFPKLSAEMGLVLLLLCVSCALSTWEQDVLNRHNELRKTKGLAPLVWDATLASQAQCEYWQSRSVALESPGRRLSRVLLFFSFVLAVLNPLSFAWSPY